MKCYVPIEEYQRIISKYKYYQREIDEFIRIIQERGLDKEEAIECHYLNGDTILFKLEPTSEEKEKILISETTKEEEPNQDENMFEVFIKIKNILKCYLDMPDRNITITALWIIGTYFYEEFETYPYLFFNAMRGSGKTRILKIIANLSNDGQLLTSLTESAMFRTKGTLAVDEFESIGQKEKQALRELLNASYKKGIKVIRMKKVKSKEGENQEAEFFEPYRPIVMANIKGMEEVLGDRCISIVIEKSDNPKYTKLVEDFYNNPKFNAIRDEIRRFSVGLCSVGRVLQHIQEWNSYITQKYNTTLTTIYLPTNTTIHIPTLYEKLDEINIDGRNLELFFPLFLIAEKISTELLEEVLLISKEMVTSKKEDEVYESKDVSLYYFVSTKEQEWVRIKELTQNFRYYIGEQEGVNEWLNDTWVGRALKRLNLILKKRRIGEGVQVIPDVEKAKEKYKLFKKD